MRDSFDVVTTDEQGDLRLIVSVSSEGELGDVEDAEAIANATLFPEETLSPLMENETRLSEETPQEKWTRRIQTQTWWVEEWEEGSFAILFDSGDYDVEILTSTYETEELKSTVKASLQYICDLHNQTVTQTDTVKRLQLQCIFDLKNRLRNQTAMHTDTVTQLQASHDQLSAALQNAITFLGIGVTGTSEPYIKETLQNLLVEGRAALAKAKEIAG
jgi:hypothetical protein